MREWDGATWQQRVTVATPPGRQRHALAFDSARGRTVVFGGGTNVTRFGDTWEYDGVSWQQALPVTNPSARDRVTMAYDPLRRHVVLCDGRGATATSNFGETWEWDGVDWALRAEFRLPAARSAHALAAAPGNAVILFGGAAGTTVFGDTWEWAGTTWVERAAAQPPPARRDHALGWDAARSRVMLFGGVDASSTLLADTWAWNGSSWTQLTLAPSPAARSGHALAFDAARNVMVLFGGHDGANPTNDTWEHNGLLWVPRAGVGNPPSRLGHALAWDARRSRIVLFGGSTDTGNAVLNDTWEYDGAQWQLRTPALRPPARRGHALGYDAVRGTVVAFGGLDASGAPLADTWEWDGFNWTQAAIAGPSARAFAGMAFDVVERRHVLFGGIGATTPNAETWELAASDAADVRVFGVGCTGFAGVPDLAPLGAPTLGNPAFALRLAALVPNAQCALVFGATRTTVELPGSACAFYPGAPLVTVGGAADGAGVRLFVFGIPNDPALVRAAVTLQGAGVDPNGGFLHALSLTRGMELTLGR